MKSKENSKGAKRLFGAGADMPLEMLVFSALLAALSIILGKYLAFNAGDFLRFSFENLPVILAGIAFGPIVGVSVGAIADVLGSLMVGYAINPIITAGAAAVGLVSGTVYMPLKKTELPLPLKIALTTVLSHIIGSVIIKTFGLHIMFGTPYPILLVSRALNYAIIAALETILISMLLSNRSIMKTFNKANKKDSFKSYANSFQAVTVPGLERIEMLLELLGNPERELKIIHVAGTNGKGSTCANLACILEDAGYRVGKYISPNLIRVNERISINGEDIADSDLDLILGKVQPLCKIVEQKLGIAPTQFEIWTAAAFLYFADEGCDFTVLEVGLGGELDATNVIKECELSIITRLGLDHVQYLGGTLAEVASAKAGIIKHRQTHDAVITVRQESEAMSVIEKRAKELNKRLVVADPRHVGTEGAGEIFSIAGINNIKCGISGLHQIENASLAALAALELGIDIEFIISGIKRAKNPARFEILSENPTVIYDGGHNENGITALMASIQKYYPERAKTVVFACMRDKEIDKSLSLLSSGDTKFIFTTVKNNPRADTAEGLRERAAKAGFEGEAYESIKDAYERAISLGRLTVICGSLYLYKDLCEYLKRDII